MADLFAQASALLAAGQGEQAQALLSQLLQQQGQSEPALAMLGHSLRMQNKLAEAEQVFEQLSRDYPQSAEAWVELASVYTANGRTAPAERAYQQALEIKPDFAEAWFFLGNLLMQNKRIEQATQCFAQAQRWDPFRAVFVDVQAALDRQDFYTAERQCRQVLASHPHHSQALFTLAKLAEQQQAYEQAVAILQRGISYAPYHVSLWEALVKNLSHLGRHTEAIEAARKLHSFAPEQLRYLMLLAVELANGGQFEQSLAVYDQALNIAPDNANLQLLRGHVLKTLGQREACEQAYQRSLTLDPLNGTGWWALADLKSYRFSADEQTKMQALLNNLQAPAAQAAQAGFALAKSYEDKGDYALAFELYEKANRLRPDVQFVPADYAHSCHVVKQAFSGDVVQQQAIHNQGPTPIFIVGLTRSGSTLLEQILASHSQIEGTMELYCMPHTVRRAELLAKQKGSYYPQVMAELSRDELTTLGRSYLQETAAFRQGKPYFIDKMPPNFHNVGFIHQILPQAIIIDARRHPLSVCLSNFKQHFARGYDFSYDLAHLGYYYNQYLSMMDHWDTVLPGKVLCIQYEQVVQDTEQQVSRMLSHCGLQFEPKCLSFYTNKRAVRTASSEQVRQPIYQQGRQQWQNFETILTPLKNALGEATLQRFAQFL